MKKTVLITGATAGFGEASAKIFADNNYRLILTGRRNERLEKLKQELNTEVYSLCFDVRNKEEVAQAIANLPKEWQNIDVLVNNAGLASGLNKIQDGNIDDWDKMIDTNVKGLLYVSNAVVPLIKKQGFGHIINIGSTAGKEVYEGLFFRCN